MSEAHRIKCGNGNCYIIKNGVDEILADTGRTNGVNASIIALPFHWD